MADSGEISSLIAALRDVGLSVPEEVETIPHLIIAVRANGRAPKDDLDDDPASPPMVMSMHRRRQQRQCRPATTADKINQMVSDLLPTPPKAGA